MQRFPYSDQGDAVEFEILAEPKAPQAANLQKAES
jgi:cold shock CspA family protein